jgi:hypothetical protein
MPKIVPYKFYRAPNGQSYSIFSSCIPEGSELVEAGFTIAWPDGTRGCGRKPFETEAEAAAYIARNPKFKGMHGIGS